MMHPYNDLIRVDELKPLIGKENLVLLDCRFYLMEKDKGRQEYLQGHIPGAYYMDTNLDLSSPVIKGVTGRHPLPHPEVISSTFTSAGINANSQVVCYDQSAGTYASRAWWLLQWLGHKQVSVLDGGWNTWLTAGHSVDNTWPSPKHSDFHPKPDQDMIVSKEYVASLKENLVDSREYKRYTGETEPIDPIAGHIPNAICLPYSDNNDEKGFWKSREWLQQKFNPVSSNTVSPVFYCGSGVTACHNILAYTFATGKMAKLYPGSWSEWILYYPAVVGN